MIEVITAISTHLVASLVTAGYPPLCPLLDGTAGRILIGRRHSFDQAMPPRVIFMPTKSAFGPRRNTLGTARPSDNASGLSAESRTALAQRSILSESITFDVACWGIASEETFEEDGAAADFEFTHALSRQVIASFQYLMPGNFKVEGGMWRDVAHRARVGREFVFGLTFFHPVLDEITTIVDGVVPGLPYAPSDVAMEHTDMMVSASGATGGGCVDDE